MRRYPCCNASFTTGSTSPYPDIRANMTTVKTPNQLFIPSRGSLASFCFANKHLPVCSVCWCFCRMTQQRKQSDTCTCSKHAQPEHGHRHSIPKGDGRSQTFRNLKSHTAINRPEPICAPNDARKKVLNHLTVRSNPLSVSRSFVTSEGGHENAVKSVVRRADFHKYQFQICGLIFIFSVRRQSIPLVRSVGFIWCLAFIGSQELNQK